VLIENTDIDFIDTLIGEWNKVSLRFAKAAFYEDHTKLFDRISDRINEIIELEKNYFANLIVKLTS
jgi:hypothetical protein